MKLIEIWDETIRPYWDTYKKQILIGCQSVILLLLLFFIFLVNRGDHAKSVTTDEILQVMQQQEGFGELMESNSMQLRKRYQIDAISSEYVLYYYMDDLMDVTEFVVIKASDSDFLDSAYEQAEVRIADELVAFGSYSADAVELLNNACVDRVGEYLFVAISRQADQWERAFLSLVQG